MTGTVLEVNETLKDEPGLVNTVAETDGWFIKMKLDNVQTSELMDTAAYKAHCEKESS